MNNGYYKITNGFYHYIGKIYIKVSGVYTPVTSAFVKINGVYEQWHGDEGSVGDPQEDLDYINITNDSISSSEITLEDSTLTGQPDIWGGGNGKDSVGTDIGSVSYCVKLPKYTPLLNVSSTWLASKGISISGSSANISRKKIIANTGALSGYLSKFNYSDGSTFDIISQDVYDNLSTKLNNNSILLQSKERQTSGGYFYPSSTSPAIGFGSSAINLVRESETFGGVKVAYKVDLSSTSTYCHWRIEVDVNYNLTFYHAESGLSRTIQKTVKFRTYN